MRNPFGKRSRKFNNDFWYKGMTLEEVLNFFQEMYGKKEGINHYNKYWENVKIIEEFKDFSLIKIYEKCKVIPNE